MRLEPNVEALLNALARACEVLGVKSAGGRIMFAAELFLASVVLLGLSMALLHEILELGYSVWIGATDFTSHSFTYIIIFMVFMIASLVFVFIREYLEERPDY